MNAYTVQQGAAFFWAVIGPDGKVVESFKTRKAARAYARSLNSKPRSEA